MCFFLELDPVVFQKSHFTFITTVKIVKAKPT